MHDALVGYRSADPYPRQSRAMIEALDDADDLKSQLPALKAYVAVLEALSRQVRTSAAEGAISDAISHLEDAMGALGAGADKAVDDCED